jgi:hypothetical protein
VVEAKRDDAEMEDEVNCEVDVNPVVDVEMMP